MNKTDFPTKLLWVDLEMTGLDPEKQRIIEVAVLVTDFELNELARYEAVIHQPEPVLEAAEDWPRENMSELFDQVRNAEKNEGTIVDDLEALIMEHFGDEPATLAGNSVHQDRRFIRQWWPGIEQLLHYRMLDVTTLKIWVGGSMDKQFEKGEQHRALEDIEESIVEFKWCLEQLASRE